MHISSIFSRHKPSEIFKNLPKCGILKIFLSDILVIFKLQIFKVYVWKLEFRFLQNWAYFFCAVYSSSATVKNVIQLFYTLSNTHFAHLKRLQNVIRAHFDYFSKKSLEKDSEIFWQQLLLAGSTILLFSKKFLGFTAID